MIEDIKVNSPKEKKGKEYQLGRDKHDVPEVVRKTLACVWTRGCWAVCWWEVESLGMAVIALKFKKEQSYNTPTPPFFLPWRQEQCDRGNWAWGRARGQMSSNYSVFHVSDKDLTRGENQAGGYHCWSWPWFLHIMSSLTHGYCKCCCRTKLKFGTIEK